MVSKIRWLFAFLIVVVFLQTSVGAQSKGNTTETTGPTTTTTPLPGGGTETITTSSETDWVPSLKPKPAQPRAPQSGDGVHDERAYLPDVAGPGSTIVATFEDPESRGPSGQAMVAFEDSTGHRSFFQVVTNAAHKTAFKVAAGAVAVWLFKHFDDRENPDNAAVKTIISRDAVVSGTEAVSNVARTGPAIERAATAYERGGASGGIFSLQTRGVDPLHAQILVDGKPLGAETLAASDRSVKARFADDEALGRHSIAVSSGPKRSNAVKADLITLRADPLPPSETGSVQTLRVHVDGLPRSDRGTMYFHIAGSARLENGGENASVPVTNGVAEVRIRGEHAGPAVVDFSLHALLDAAEGESPTTGHTRTRETPGPGLRPPATPTPTPIGPGDIGKPNIYGHEPLTPCKVHIEKGWFEPSQGVWQDDQMFDDQTGKELYRTDHGGNPTYDAELPMVWERDTYLYGVVHYRRSGAEEAAGWRGAIIMEGTSNCSQPPTNVRMRFTVYSGAMGERIYTSPDLTKISLSGGGGKPKRWTAKLLVGYGVPEGKPPYKFTSAGPYRIEDELVTDKGVETGLKVIVNGNVVQTQGLRVGFVSVFAPKASPKDDSRDIVQLATAGLTELSNKYIPDLFPMRPGTFDGNVADDEDMTGPDFDTAHDPHAPLNNRLDAALRLIENTITKYDLLAHMEGYSRMVLVTNHGAMHALAGPVAGYAATDKVVLVLSDSNQTTVEHELAHTMPFLWSSDQMEHDCTKPGDYHNSPFHAAWGVQIDEGGAPKSPPEYQDAKLSIMGPKTDDASLKWNDQCTYWNLTSYMQHVEDPPVILLRGSLARRTVSSNVVKADLLPAYDLLADLRQPKAPMGLAGKAWHILLRDASARVLADYSFVPLWTDEDRTPRRVTFFSYHVPYRPSLASIELRGPHGEDRRLAASTTPFTTHIDNVTTLAKHRITMSWSLSDRRRAWNSIVVLKNRRVVEMPLAESHAQRASFTLPGAGAYVIHLFSSDGVQSARDQGAVAVH